MKKKLVTVENLYPIGLIKDRYGGSYSKGIWTAWNCFGDKIPRETELGDPICEKFWTGFEQGKTKLDCVFTPKLYVGRGKDPASALQDLIKQMNK